MANGVMTKVVETGHDEKKFSHRVSRVDDILTHLREIIRRGDTLTEKDLEGVS
jgi:hypothetical protein